MCYSVEVERELKRIEVRFRAQHSPEDELKYAQALRLSEDPAFLKRALNLGRSPKGGFFKWPGEDNRIYPGYFGWVLTQENGELRLKRMRYRIRTAGSAAEIPTKYNVFNARSDSLLQRPTWKSLFGRQHGVFPFRRFYEWVEHEGVKRQISFAPKDRELMWAPCLWDYWENKDLGFGFYSFALITQDPPPEVQAMGHDRCPVFLREDQFPKWLSPKGQSPEELLELLSWREEVYYLSKWAS